MRIKQRSGKAVNMHFDKKEFNADGNYVPKKTPVLGMRQREGHVIAKGIDTQSTQEIN